MYFIFHLSAITCFKKWGLLPVALGKCGKKCRGMTGAGRGGPAEACLSVRSVLASAPSARTGQCTGSPRRRHPWNGSGFSGHAAKGIPKLNGGP